MPIPTHTVSSAQLTKTLLGQRRITYKCPKCNSDLFTNVAGDVSGDTCPDCRCSFTFSASVRTVIERSVSEEAEAEAEKERKVTERAEQRKKQQEAQRHAETEAALLAQRKAEQDRRQEQDARASQLRARLYTVTPDGPTNTSGHRSIGTARSLRILAWLILLGGIFGGFASGLNKATEVGLLAIPTSILVSSSMFGFAAVIDLLAEACVLLRRIDDRDALRQSDGS